MIGMGLILIPSFQEIRPIDDLEDLATLIVLLFGLLIMILTSLSYIERDEK